MEYPISPNYCKNWTIIEAIREIIANARDTKAAITINWKDGFAIVRDAGPGLKREHFVLGEGEEKTQEQIGQFKEGLKIAALVFARERRIFRGKTKDFGFEFSLKKSDNFECQVLNLELNGCTTPVGTEITFECAQDELNEARNLFIDEIEATILPDKPGELYISGVFVQKINSLFGYNITTKEAANRDRSVLDMNKVKLNIGALLSRTRSRDVIQGYLTSKKQQIEHEVLFDIENEEIKLWKSVIYSLYGKKCCIANGDESFAIDKGYYVFIAISYYQRITLASIIPYSNDVVKKREPYNHKSCRKILTPEQKIKLSTAHKIAQKVLATKIPLTVVDKLEEMTKNRTTFALYDPKKKRTFLSIQAIDGELEELVGVLLHEGLHQTTNTIDLTREFEGELTNLAGRLACQKK